MYRPAALIVPPDASCTDQVTPWSEVPVTVAVKDWVPPVWSAAVGGETVTVIVGDSPTVTVATPVAVRSTVLAATTWKVPFLGGAV